MATEKARFLKKDEELHIGGLIQAHYRAKEKLASGARISAKTRAALEECVTIGVEAIDTLVNANIGLVHSQAYKFKARYPSGPELEDLIQSGMEGLMTAVRKYDPKLGNKFSTVAFYWIAQAIGRSSNKYSRLVRLPENRINDFIKMNKITNALAEEELSSAEIDRIIMEKLKISASDLSNIRAASYTPASLNKPVGYGSGTSGTRELIDVVADSQASPSSESTALDNRMREILLNAVQSLPVMRREVMLAKFPIGSDDDLTTAQVREKYNINPSKMSRIEAEVVTELQKTFECNGFTFSDFAESI